MKAKFLLLVLPLVLLNTCTSDDYEFEYEYEFLLYNYTDQDLYIDWIIDGAVYHTNIGRGPYDMYAGHSFLTHSHMTIDQLNDLYDCVVYNVDTQYVVDLNKVRDLRYYTLSTEKNWNKPQVATNYLQYHYTLTD